ncbi:MAG TPA: efflux RND transporter permease subunit [Gemmataceae bacterium]|nr:efflux RND transporter permease subunit [Gemmataceae bacterium]
MLPRFFIDRPIFAAVLSLVITLAGGLALFTLPLSLYPPISPPIVQVDCVYPGANARVVAETVAAPIEQEVNGVEGMLYMSSQCGNDGSYNLRITFRNGMDLNMVQVLVQNRVNLAMPQLPDVIKRSTVTIRKRSPDILLSTGFYSTNNRYDQLYLSNYALMQVREELARVPGVSDVTMVGQRDYSMRIWLDPGKLAVRGLTANDAVRAIREQNTAVAAGHLGQEPAKAGLAFQVPLDVQGRLSEAEEFGNIVLKTGDDGRVLRLKDVARVELGPKNVDLTCHVDGKAASSLTVWQLPGANALETADRVKAKLEELKKGFPPGVDYVIRYDTTPFIRESIGEVVKTLRDATILVAAVVLLFLQNWRSALIPLIAVPVAIIGTFAAMAVLGFSLNNLTLFGLVLAIGIVVDDAIVVVEAVEHHIEHGLAPREATIKAMEQVAGPVVAVGLVLSAVFLPCAFMGGITGRFFWQFALTIAVSTLISAFNSLTLSPALTALLLKPHDKHAAPPLPRLAFLLVGGWVAWSFLTDGLTAWLQRGMEYLAPAYAASLYSILPWLAPGLLIVLGTATGWLLGGVLNRVLGWSFRMFNAGFTLATHAYTRTVAMLLRVSLVVLVIYGGLLALTYWRFTQTPKGFIPTQDMGYLLIDAQLPDAAAAERTQAVMDQAEQLVLHLPGIKHALTVSGQSFLLSANGSNFGSMFVILDDFDKRQDPHLTADAIAATLRKRFRQEIFEADFTILGPPPVRGVGRAGGFKIMLEDRGDLGLLGLQEQTDRLVAAGREQRGLIGMKSVFRANVPQLYVDVDSNEVRQKHVSLKEVTDALAIYQGSMYVNDFNRFGRTWQVIVQAESPYRQHPETIGQLQVRNEQGKMVPLGSLAHVREVNGPLIVTRYNMHTASFITGSGAPGTSSGQAITLMEEQAHQNLSRAMAYEWTETAYLELQAGNTAMIIFGLSVALVFLVLAALYESWSLPLAVILIVPLCLLSSVVGVGLAHLDINILTQVGFVMLVGLASKNAILVVEFAKVQRESGVSRREATLAACRLRLRPIVMTSLAFILGVVPLMVSHGAGAEMRRTLGTAVFSGMLGVTVVGLFLTPVFFYVINGLSNSVLFTSHPARLLGRVLLDVTTLGLHRIVGPVIRRRRGRVQVGAVSTTNGRAKVPATSITDATPTHSASDGRQPSDSPLI